MEKGSYIAYVLAFNLGIDALSEGDLDKDLSDEELQQRTDLEHYNIVLVSGSSQTEGVIKGEEYLY